MSITTTSQLLYDGLRNVSMQFTGFVAPGDSGQEALVIKVDVSTLTPPAASVKIKRIQYEVSGGLVRLWWGATDAPVPFLDLAKVGDNHYDRIGGLVNGADANVRTGDILFSTIGFDIGSSYSIVLDMVKKD